MSLRGFFGILLATLLLFACGPAFAGKRVALVLGNSAYQNVPRLTNPVNDAGLMTETFKKAGFDVVVSRNDLGALETRRALRDFSDSAADADIAVIYYAGHGIEVDGTNYLIPVDAKLERDNDVFDEAFSLDRVLLAVEPAKKLRLVILDACRDNPFAKTMRRTVALRAIGRGLAKIEPNNPNTLIAYSAKAGSTAQDGDGKDSPFTIALSQHLTTPGLDVRKAFGFVRDDVIKSTGSRQEPFVYGSLGGDDVPLVPAPAVAAPAPATANPQADIRRDYELALQLGNKSAFNAFLAQHPDGFYASLAKLQLEKLTAEDAHAMATAKAKEAEEQRARLAAEGAQKDAQARADADAKAAEGARLAAEKAKQVAQDQAAAAERKRAEVAAATAAATPAPATTAAPEKVAALNPTAPAPADLTKSVQAELRRVGCLKDEANGDWNASSQRSLSAFNRNAGTKLDVKTVSVDTLDAIKQKPSRVCPLVCEHGFKADGDQCVKIVCAEGTVLNDDNQCEKRREKKPVATREKPEGRQAPSAAPAPYGGQGSYGGQAPPRPQASAGGAYGGGRAGGGSGQIYCDNGGCRPVARGCHLGYNGGGASQGNIANPEVCN
jgi:uncharacterized caspase-like protein